MADAEGITALLCSRRYNRYRVQDRGQVHATVAEAMEAAKPITLVGYWGVPTDTGSRMDQKAGKAALQRIEDIAGKVRESYSPGARVTLIISDTHAALNGALEGWSEDYIRGIEALARTYQDIATVRMSALLAGGTCSPPEAGFAKDPVLKATLLEGARRHYHGQPEEGARRYFETRIAEASVIERKFAGSLFFTYNPPCYSELFPKLPTLFLYAGAEGSKPPWIG